MAGIDVSGLLTEAFETFREDPLDFLILGLLAFVVPVTLALLALVAVWGPSFLILLGSLGPDPSQAIERVFQDVDTLPAFLATFLGGLVAAVLVGVLVWTIFYGALLGRARGTEETGRDVESALRTGVRRFLPLFGVAAVVTVLFLVVLGLPLAVVVWAFVQVTTTGNLGGLLVAAGVALLALLAGGLVLLFVVAGLFVAPPTVVVEDLPAASAMRRSWELTRGHRLLVLVVIIVGVVLQAAIALAADLVFAPFAALGADASPLAGLVSGVLNACVWPLLSLKAYEQLAEPPATPDPAPGAGEAVPADSGGYVPLE